MPLSMAPPTAAAPAAFPRLKMPTIALPDQVSPPPPLSVVSRRVVAPPKHKAVVVLGATGTGKSRLAIDLALRFGGEVINSDKMQVYAGLDVATNKVGPEDCLGVPHHLLGVVAHPDAEFTAADFRREASRAAASVAARGRVPIVAGGSNSYVEELLVGGGEFRDRYACCFLWVDAHLPVLRDFVARRVEEMLRRGLVDEVAAAFDPRRTDYSTGIWRAIGVPELDAYLRARHVDDDERQRLLVEAVEEIKENTFRLACRQRGKIQRLARMWRVRRVDATEVFMKRGHAADEAWQRLVAAPSIDAVRAFLMEDQEYSTTSSSMGKSSAVFATAAAAAVAAAAV